MKAERDQSIHYCLPVELSDGRFVVAIQWRKSGLKLTPLRDKRLEYLNSCVAERVGVEIAGKKYKATVYQAATSDEFDYVIVDSNWVPVERDLPSAQLDHSVFQKYLEEVRVSLCFTEGILPDQRAYLWTDYQERTCDISPRQGPARRESGWRSISTRSRLLITGMAGAGKTTLLRRMAIGIADETSEAVDASVPVYIQLRNWVKGKGIERLVRQVLAPHVPETVQNISEFSRSGKFVFLFDGLDEVPSEERNEAIRDLREFMESHAECRFVISSRPNAAPAKLQNEFDHCDLLGMSGSEMKELSAMHLQKRGKNSAGFWSRLESEPDIFDIGSNPLVLTLMLTRYVRDSLSPHFVGEALTAMTDALTDEWDSVRGVRRSLAPILTPKHKLSLLRHLAAVLTDRQQTEFSEAECTEIMSDFAAREDLTETLRELEEHTGLITRTKASQLTFSHRAVQDFLSAVSLGDRSLHSPEIARRSDAHARAWRYACWTSNDGAKLINERVTGPYELEDVILSAKAFSQNLVVHRDVVHGFALSVSWALDSLLSEIEFDASPAVEGAPPPTPRERSVVCTVRGSSALIGNLRKLGELISTLHRARDGIAFREVKERLDSSGIPATRSVSALLRVDGVFSWETSSEAHQAILRVFLKY